MSKHPQRPAPPTPPTPPNPPVPPTPPAQPDKPSYPPGPLHLQRHLAPCTEQLGKVLRLAVAHRMTGVHSLYCRCGASGKYPLTRKTFEQDKSIAARTAEARKKLIESSRSIPVVRAKAPDGSALAPDTDDRRETCRFFAIQMNDEAAIIHAHCRRCEHRIVVYDRDLYWGCKRQSGITPPTYPYRCSCGGHAFEVAVGFDYPEDALDENDITTISVAVRCVTCGEEAMIFDDEAT